MEGSKQEREKIRCKLQEDHFGCHVEDGAEWEAEAWSLKRRLEAVKRKREEAEGWPMEIDGLSGEGGVQDEAWGQWAYPQDEDLEGGRGAEVKTR